MRHIDCDAVLLTWMAFLIDSTVCIRRHWQQWAQQHGLDVAHIMPVAHGRRTIETIRLVAPHLYAEEEAQHFAALEVVDNYGVITIEGASPLLKLLPTDTWAMHIGNERRPTARLKARGPADPRILVAADDVTHGKPDPDLSCGGERLGIPADKCVVIEDSPAGLKRLVRPGCKRWRL